MTGSVEEISSTVVALVELRWVLRATQRPAHAIIVRSGSGVRQMRVSDGLHACTAMPEIARSVKSTMVVRLPGLGLLVHQCRRYLYNTSRFDFSVDHVEQGIQHPWHILFQHQNILVEDGNDRIPVETADRGANA